MDKVSKQRFDMAVLGICGSAASTLSLSCPCRRSGVACCRLTNSLCCRFHFRPGHAFIHSLIHSLIHSRPGEGSSWRGTRARVSIVSIASILLAQARSWPAVGSSSLSDHPSLPHHANRTALHYSNDLDSAPSTRLLWNSMTCR